MNVYKIDDRDMYSYSLSLPNKIDYKNLADDVLAGKDIWYRFTSGARTGTIAKVIAPQTNVFDTTYKNFSIRRGSFEVDIGNGKTLKVGVKSYHNGFEFLTDYTGGYVNHFTKGAASKDKPLETGQPDMLGNTIRVGDWVIFIPHGRYTNKPGLGKLNRLSAAGSAWVMTPNKQGNEVEVRTDGASSLIKVTMTPELHTTYVLCDSIQGLRTKLVIDLDVD